jgi:amidase
VRTGCKLYIPIEVPGALFSLGDVHARQGDGEVVGAPEIGARVRAHFEIKPGRHAEWFMIEDSTSWHSPISAPTETEAARKAVFQNARFIERNHAVAFEDALIILTMIGRLSISLTGIWYDPAAPVVCSSFSKQTLRDALTQYRTSG